MKGKCLLLQWKKTKQNAQQMMRSENVIVIKIKWRFRLTHQHHVKNKMMKKKTGIG